MSQEQEFHVNEKSVIVGEPTLISLSLSIVVVCVEDNDIDDGTGNLNVS